MFLNFQSRIESNFLHEDNYNCHLVYMNFDRIGGNVHHNSMNQYHTQWKISYNNSTIIKSTMH